MSGPAKAASLVHHVIGHGASRGLYWNLSSSRASFASPLLLMHDIPKPQTTELLIKAMNVARVLTSCRILQDKPFWWVVHVRISTRGASSTLRFLDKVIRSTPCDNNVTCYSCYRLPPPLAQTRWNYGIMVFSLSNIRRPPIFIVIVSLKKIESNVKCSPWAQASVH